MAAVQQLLSPQMVACIAQAVDRFSARDKKLAGRIETIRAEQVSSRCHLLQSRVMFGSTHIIQQYMRGTSDFATYVCLCHDCALQLC
jgi:hypothetical protein